MKYLIGALLLLFVAASIALFAAHDSGYVLISREPFVFETSLIIFLLLLAALFVLLYFAARIISRVLRAPHKLARWRQAHRTRKARESFEEGIRQLLSGEWLAAEKSLLGSLHGGDTPHFGWMAAALAAQGRRDTDKRNEYLANAAAQMPGQHSLPVRLLQARLQLATDELEAAHATLADLRSAHPQQPEVARLLIECTRRLRDWQALARLLPDARRRQLLPEDKLTALEKEAHGQLLNLDLPAGALDSLHQAWNAAPDSVRHDPLTIKIYARQLVRQGALDECLQLLATELDRSWNEELVSMFGTVRGPRPKDQIDTAEEWLARHGESAALYLALGRLARQSGDPQRARHWLERSLALGKRRDAHVELGELFAHEGNKELALAHYRDALGSDR